MTALAAPARTATGAMNPRLTMATTTRVLRQLRHDHRTIAMMLVLPSVLLGLLYLLWKDVPALPGQPSLFDRVGLAMIGIFPFIVMFLVTSIAMLRERTSGTLERLLTTPLSKTGLLAGYGLAFGAAATLQAVVTFPQFFLCGLLMPRDQMIDWLRWISDVLPLTYAVEALQEVGRSATETGTMWRDVGIAAGAAVLALALAAATLRRRSS